MDENVIDVADTEGTGPLALFDEEGLIRSGSLSKGMFTLRFTPELDAMVFTWIPDDLGEPVQRTRHEIPKPDPNEPVTGLREYLDCLNKVSGQAVGEEAVEAGLKRVFSCAAKLLE